MFKYILAIMVFLACHFTLHGQDNNFGIKAGLGFNVSQIRGDSLQGYHHLGTTINGEVTYSFSPKWTGSALLSYSQEGSSDQLRFTGSNQANNRYLDLNYIQVGFLMQYKEWEESGIDKLSLLTGLSYNNLVSRKKKDDFLGFPADDMNSSTIDALVGIEFALIKQLSLRFAYERSITNIYQNDNFKLVPFSLKTTIQYKIK